MTTENKKQNDPLPDNLLKIIDKHFQTAVRGSTDGLYAHLEFVDKIHDIEGTSTKLHCHVLKLDGNSRPKDEHLAQYLTDLVIDYAIPRGEIHAAYVYQAQTNSTEKVAALKRKAKDLFVDLANTSGEGGEILLFALAEKYLKLPQLICKMPLKTSSQVHYHGIDGVHAKIDKEKNKLCIYWGESKLHKDIGDALSDGLDTIRDFLNSSSVTGSRASRDIDLIRDNVSLSDPETQNTILAILDENHELFNHVQFRAICLAGFDFIHYPSGPNQKNLTEIVKEAEKELENWKKMLKTRLQNRENLVTFEIEILLVPFPDVEKFRKTFVSMLGFGNG